MPSFACYGLARDLHSFPTRRSSDLAATLAQQIGGETGNPDALRALSDALAGLSLWLEPKDAAALVQTIVLLAGKTTDADTLRPLVRDRKSTRLNSSHLGISYAVVCLLRPRPRSPLFPYTTLFRSRRYPGATDRGRDRQSRCAARPVGRTGWPVVMVGAKGRRRPGANDRSARRQDH